MVKVGKLKMTESEKKRTFHLPIEQAIIVPSTSGVKTQRIISKAQLNQRVNTVRKYLSKKFGGYTSTKATGGFILDSGKLVKEKAIKVTSFGTKKSFKKHRPEIIQQVGEWGKKWKQESVSYEHEGDLYIIEPPKMTKVKSLIKRKILLSRLKKARKMRKKKR